VKIVLISLLSILSVVLILAIVAQESKTPGMGSAIGGGTESLMGGRSRGKDAVLSRITVVCGILFAILCLALGRYMNTF
jgi:preprotein translocase subunit SecG